MAVDEMHMNTPHMTKDMYWNEPDVRPPYTRAAADYCIPSFLGSTTDMGWAGVFLHIAKEISTKPMFLKIDLEALWGWPAYSNWITFFSFRLSEIMQGEDIDIQDPRPQGSVLGRMRRLLSVQEPPNLHIRPSFKRHSSDITSFFPFVPEHRIYGGPEDSVASQHRPYFNRHPHPVLDTLSTLREVNSTPSSPDTPMRSPSHNSVPTVVVSDSESQLGNHGNSSSQESSVVGKVPLASRESSIEPNQSQETNSHLEEVSDEEIDSHTETGPRRFRGRPVTDRAKKRQLSFPLSRQNSRSSMRSLPSPKTLLTRRGPITAPTLAKCPQMEMSPTNDTGEASSQVRDEGNENKWQLKTAPFQNVLLHSHCVPLFVLTILNYSRTFFPVTLF